VCSSLSRPPTPTLLLADELTCGALDVIRLRFVPRNALSNTAAHQVSPPACQMFYHSRSCLPYPPPKIPHPLQSFKFHPPLYAHQIFGDDECIYGYFSPEIDITYSEDSLLPAITFTHIPQAGKFDYCCDSMNMCIDTYIYMYIQTCVCMYMYVHIYIYIYIYVY